MCEIGSSTKENFQVQTKEFLIEIESKSFHPYDLTSASIRDIKPTSEFTTPYWSHSSPSEAVGAHVADAERQHGRDAGVPREQAVRRLPVVHPLRSHLQLPQPADDARGRQDHVLRLHRHRLRRHHPQRRARGQRRLDVPAALQGGRLLPKRHGHCSAFYRKVTRKVNFEYWKMTNRNCSILNIASHTIGYQMPLHFRLDRIRSPAPGDRGLRLHRRRWRRQRSGRVLLQGPRLDGEATDEVEGQFGLDRGRFELQF